MPGLDLLVRSFSTSSRPALLAAACGGRPRPAPNLGGYGATLAPHQATFALGAEWGGYEDNRHCEIMRHVQRCTVPIHQSWEEV
jgi:hypothetical protein